MGFRLNVSTEPISSPLTRIIEARVRGSKLSFFFPFLDRFNFLIVLRATGTVGEWGAKAGSLLTTGVLSVGEVLPDMRFSVIFFWGTLIVVEFFGVGQGIYLVAECFQGLLLNKE